jgi:hypothetical protein
VFEGGEEALHHRVVPAAALGRHAATDLMGHQAPPVGRSPVLGSLVRMDQKSIRLNLPVTQSPVQVLQHQRGLHGGAHGPSDDAAAVQVDPDGQVLSTRCGAVVGGIIEPAEVGGCWSGFLLQQIFRDSGGLVCAVARVLARPEPASGLGLERGITHQPSDPVPTNLVVSSPQLLVDSRRAVETTVPFKHFLHLTREDRVLTGTTARVLLSLPPGIEAAARHTQLPAHPGHRKAIR